MILIGRIILSECMFGHGLDTVYQPVEQVMNPIQQKLPAFDIGSMFSVAIKAIEAISKMGFREATPTQSTHVGMNLEYGLSFTQTPCVKAT